MENDIKYMARALQLAANGLGSTYPNPMVGAVIVAGGKIIGEGWHRRKGEPHAEVNAVRSVQDKALLKKSTMYVTLEPCSHYGATPPCAEMIVREGIPRVVVAMTDPNPLVDGKGIGILRKAGIEVRTGVLEAEARELNRRFITYFTKKRPYIILKWAQSADGYIDRIRNDAQTPPVQISNRFSRMLTHRWRSEEQAIWVGTRTALFDNPRLDVRLVAGHSPLRVVLDRENCIPESFHLKDGTSPTLVFNGKRNAGKGTNTEYIAIVDWNQTIPAVLDQLYQRGIQSVLVEGGSKLLQSLIDGGYWDQARVFTAPLYLGSGVAAPVLPPAGAAGEENIAGDTLKLYRNR